MQKQLNQRFQGLIDPHLNVFCCYDDKAVHLENNITKAFINTLSSLSLKEIKDVFRNLFAISLDDETEYSFDFFLQRSPNKEVIESIPSANRVMFAFSPTGEHWDIKGTDTKDVNVIRSELQKIYKEKFPLISIIQRNEAIDNEIKTIMSIQIGRAHV